MNYSLGIDMGNTSIKIVVLTESKEIAYKKHLNHYGNPAEVVQDILKEVSLKFLDQYFCIMLTGSNASLVADQSYIAHDVQLQILL